MHPPREALTLSAISTYVNLISKFLRNVFAQITRTYRRIGASISAHNSVQITSKQVITAMIDTVPI